VRCAYAVEFRTAEGEALAISIPRSEATGIRHFQERMPSGLRPEVPTRAGRLLGSCASSHVHGGRCDISTTLRIFMHATEGRARIWPGR
jgi:hypothetical protein